MDDYLEKKREIEAPPDPIRILHLEDDPKDEEIVRSTLESEGIACQIVCTRTGRDFLKALELHTFDLILADNLLPDFGGMDALKMVREVCPQVPFIFVTGTMGEEFAVETLKLGAKDYVLKDRLFRLVPSVRRALREVREHKNRQKVEDELQKLFLAVEQSGSLVTITDSSDKIEFANPKFLQVSGYTLEEVLGKTPDFFRSPDSGSDVWEPLWERIRRGEEWKGELLNRNRQGENYLVSTLVSPIKNQAGVITHHLWMQEDITRQRIIEEGLRQTEKLSMMGTMLAEVTHEILNPLTVIKIYAELMEGEEERKEIKESLRVIIDQVRKAVRITDGLKTFARPKNRTVSPLNIQETFDKTIFLIENDLKSENISLERKFLQDIPWIYADEDKLFQVFLNLLKNSKEAIVENRTQKENRISVEAKVEGDRLAVTVSDDGPGMASHIIKRIFDPFFTTKEIGKGTGLGLSVVKSIMEEHHGTIQVQSTEGKGTTFVLHFPLMRTGP